MSTAAGVRSLELIAPVALALVASLAVRRREALLLAGAAIVLVGAGLPPLHDYAHRSVTGHMIQHLLLVLVAAPIAGIALTDLPGRWRARRPLRRATAAAIRAPHAPVIAGLAHALTMMIWHVPAVYDAALGNGALHAAEHLSMLGTATWWWSAVWHHARRAAIVAPALSLFMVATAGAALGVLMMFAPLPLYAHGTLADQQAAGALMAGGTGGLQMLAAIALVAAAVRRLDAPRPLRIPVVPAVLLAAGVIGVASAVPGDTGRADSPVAAAAEVGRDLYRRDCAACHGPAGEGSPQGVSISEVGTASVFYALSTGRMPIADADDPIRRADPAYDAAEIDAIVAYTRGFVDGPEPPPIEPGAGDLATGGARYRLHCAACHSATGIGGAQAFDREAPSLMHASPDETAAAIVAGPGGMPSFRSTFSDDEIAGIARHVELLQDPPTTGVAIPGGRVGEGLVGWIGAVGALVLAAAWIGRRG